MVVPRFTTRVLLPVNIKTSSSYPSPSSHVTLCFVSALRCKNLVVSSGIGGGVDILRFVFVCINCVIILS